MATAATFPRGSRPGRAPVVAQNSMAARPFPRGVNRPRGGSPSVGAGHPDGHGLSARLLASAAALSLAASFAVPAESAVVGEQDSGTARAIWLDVDPAVRRGGHEPDDGVALALAFASPEVRVAGVSVVFGNAPLAVGLPIAESLAARFGPPGLEVHRGAASPSLEPTPASRAILRALSEGPLSVAALGPATNLAAALTERPDLASRLETVALVVGRRPTGALTFPGDPNPLPDFNFEFDPAAVEVVLASGAPIVLVPFEFAVALPVTAADWAGLWDTPFGAVFRGPVEDYLDWFEEHTGRRATYPFDSFALTWFLAPDLLRCEPARVAVRPAPEDAGSEGSAGSAPWLVRLDETAGEESGAEERPPERARPVTWCHAPTPGLKPFLLRRLAAR